MSADPSIPYRSTSRSMICSGAWGGFLRRSDMVTNAPGLLT